MENNNPTRKYALRGRRRWQSLDMQSSPNPGLHNPNRFQQTPAPVNASPSGTTSTTDTPAESIAIPQSEDHIRKLRKLILSEETLQKRGYVLKQLTASDLESRRKRQPCQRCGQKIPRENRRQAATKQEVEPGSDQRLPDKLQSVAQPEDSTPLVHHDHIKEAGSHKAAGLEPSQECVYHDGYKNGYGKVRKWTCCGSPGSTGCKIAPAHCPRTYRAGDFEAHWQFYTTPTRLASAASTNTHAAVSIDCEMGTAVTGESELISVTAVDYFSGRVLLDSLVYPAVQMAHYNTRFTGLKRRDLERARQLGQCLRGRNAARNALFQFIGPDTIVIGHDVGGDLRCLRWIHRTVVDTLVIEQERRARRLMQAADVAMAESAEAVGGRAETASEDGASDMSNAAGTEMGDKTAFKVEVAVANLNLASEGNTDPVNTSKPRGKGQPGGVSLKALVLERLGRSIQNGAHGSLEDALATRDLLHWMVTQAPEAQEQ